MDRYGHLFDRAYADVSKELEAAWTASALQADPVEMDATSLRDDAAATEETPAKAAI